MGARQFKSNNGNVTLSGGNLKLDKSIAIFNLPAGSAYTCKQDCPGCYAKKAQVMYKQVIAYRIANWEASKSETFVNDFCEALKQSKKTVVRLHESGDIYSQDYCDKLSQIAANNPDITFYYYTKTDYRVKGNNVNCVNSVLPCGNLNYGSLKYVKAMSKKHSIPVCPVTLQVKGAKCGTTCKMCFSKANMLFVIH